MEVNVEEFDGAKAVQPIGSLDTQTSPAVLEKLTQLVECGATKIVIDFKEVDYVSSAGLRVLLVAAKQLQRVKGEMRVCNLNTAVKEVFDISGFGKILAVYETRPKALEGL